MTWRVDVLEKYMDKIIFLFGGEGSSWINLVVLGL